MTNTQQHKLLRTLWGTLYRLKIADERDIHYKYNSTIAKYLMDYKHL